MKMPIEIHLPDPDTTSITSSSSEASSLLLYTDHTHNHNHDHNRRTTTLTRRLSTWLSRRISRQGLNATYETSHNHNHNHPQNDGNEDGDDKISNPTRRTERDLAESYAAYCRAFTSAGQRHYHQRRKTWMMDGQVDIDIPVSSDLENSNEMQTHRVHVHAEERVDEKRETIQIPAEPVPAHVLPPDAEEAGKEPLPPPQILTPSLYAEMRRAACDKKRTRQRHRRLWSWFPHIRHRESH